LISVPYRFFSLNPGQPEAKQIRQWLQIWRQNIRDEHLMVARLSLFLALLAPASPGAARDYDAAFDNLSNISDRRGNYISVSNRTAGNSSQVRLSSLNRYGNTNWYIDHADGSTERATSFYIDGSGAIVVAGVRLAQGINYVWLMKYSGSGQFFWESADAMAGCAAFDVVSTQNGGAWVAASCIDGQSSLVRLLHYHSAGYLLWAQNSAEGGRSYVRNLNVDFMNRVSMTIEIDNGYGARSARTMVYDANGGRLAIY